MHNEQILPDEWDAVTPGQSRRFYSLGYCCHLMAASPGQLRVLMEATGTVFDHVVDGVAFVDGNQFDTLIEKRKSVLAEIESARTSHVTN